MKGYKMAAAAMVMLALLASPAAAKWGDRIANKKASLEDKDAHRLALTSRHAKPVANTTDVSAVYEFSIGLLLTADEYNARVAADAAAQTAADAAAAAEPEGKGHHHNNLGGSPGLEIGLDFSAESFDGITPAFGAGGFAAFSNEFDQEAVVKGLRNLASPGTTTITYAGRTTQDFTEAEAGNLSLLPSGLKIKFENDVLFSRRRQLLAPVADPPCDFTVLIGDNPQNATCQATFSGSTSEVIVFGDVSTTLAAFFQPSLRFNVACTLDGKAPVQTPPGCLSSI